MHIYDTFIYLEVNMGDINTIQSIEVSAVHRRLNVNELYLFLYSIELRNLSRPIILSITIRQYIKMTQLSSYYDIPPVRFHDN